MTKRLLLILSLLFSGSASAVDCPVFAAGDLDYISKLNTISNGCVPTVPAAGSFTTLTLTSPLTVPYGGTGRATSTTAYGLIAAGTTATGAHQTLAAGATTEILVGGGASALPVWTTATGTGAPVRADSATVTGTWTLPSTTSIGTVSSTELGYVDGVTSAIQTQLDAKAATTATRVKLTAARTYYVRTDGNDSNTCLADTAGGACLTIQAAVNLAAAIDNGGYDVTIQVRDGTYAEDVSFKTIVGAGSLIVQGNAATPANVVGKTFACSYTIGNYTVKDLVLTNGSVGSRLTASGRGCVISFSAVTFGGTTSTQHIGSVDGAVAKATGNYTISAGTAFHFYSANTGSIEVRSKTVTISGTPAFSTAFAYTQILGQMLLDGNTWSGSATGPRYSVTLNSVIYTAGGGATYLPGNSAGSTATGGQYN